MIFKLIKPLVFCLSIYFLQGCASHHRIKAPVTPIVRPVNVTNHCVCGEELDKVIDNWIDLGEAFKKCLTTGDFK